MLNVAIATGELIKKVLHLTCNRESGGSKYESY